MTRHALLADLLDFSADPGWSAADDALLAHGTTSAMLFPTVHEASADALFAAAQQHGMRVIAGQCLMDRDAPPELTVNTDPSERDGEALIARGRGEARLAHAETLRFAPTSCTGVA